MDKVVRIGTKATDGGRVYSVYVHVRYEDGKLSITGVEGPLPSGNCLGACGQIDMSSPDFADVKPAPSWSGETLAHLWRVWQNWHLNDLRPGCEHQQALGWTRYDDHPSESCPSCGYRFGTAWRLEPVPQEVLDWLAGLPDADRAPAWV